ncbi:cullin repeat-like-containing domain-containing protein [Tanacetum coccineum]
MADEEWIDLAEEAEAEAEAEKEVKELGDEDEELEEMTSPRISLSCWFGEVKAGLSSLVDSVHFAVTYCSLMERQKLVLRPCFVEHSLPCMEGILSAHFDHVKKLISIFMPSEGWVIGRYLVSGMFTGGTSLIVYEHCHMIIACLPTVVGSSIMSLLQLCPIFKSTIHLSEIFGEKYISDDLKKAWSFKKKTLKCGPVRLHKLKQKPKSVVGRISMIAQITRITAAREWNLDSGATIHVVGSRNSFTTYRAVTGRQVMMANRDKADVCGVGTVQIKFTSGKTVTLHNVLHVPTISKSLVSVGKLDEHGFKIAIESRKVVITKCGLLWEKDTTKKGCID